MTSTHLPTSEDTMKRRLFALGAVPVLALGFAFASPGTDQAQAYLSIHQQCALIGMKMAEAEYYGDWASYDYYYSLAERGCIPDPE